MPARPGLPDDSRELLAQLLGSKPRWIFTALTAGTSAAALAVLLDGTAAEVAGAVLPFGIGRTGAVVTLFVLAGVFGLHAAMSWRARFREVRGGDGAPGCETGPHPGFLHDP